MTRALPDGFVATLQGLVGERFVRTDDDTLTQCAKDETPNLTPARPDVVVRPGSADEVAAVVKACSDAGVYVTPRGAGTGKSGGAVPVFGGVVLLLDRINRVVSIDVEDLTATVEPGVILGEFQTQCEALGLFYPPDPASLANCTIGGNVAENAGGPNALKYGVTGTYVLGLEAVLPSGERIKTGRRTTKGVAGYDLTSLLVGSEGTLAIVTSITLKLLPLPRHVATAIASFPSSEAAIRAVSAILAGGILPRTLEYLDEGLIAAVRAVNPPYKFAAGVKAAVLVETDGDSEQGTLESLAAALEIATKHGATDAVLAQDARQRRDIWTTRRALSEATRKIKKRKVSEDIVVPRSKIPEMVARTNALGLKHGLATCSFGHAGDGNLHTQILFDDEGELPRVEALLDDLFATTLELGGTITGEHGVGVSKKRYLPLEQSALVLELQQRIKDAFDPKGILNPGKFLPDRPPRTPAEG